MRTSRKLIYFLQYMGLGIWIPVLSLTMLSKGCTYQTLAIAMASYSAITILLEVPSGIFADRYGRKLCFLLSCLFFALHIIFLLLASNLLSLIPSLLFYGIGRAFSSGSLDALFVEEYTEKNGTDNLSAITGQMIFYQMTGLIAGTVIGGALPSYHQYMFHSYIRLFLLAATFSLCFLLVSEAPKPRGEKRQSLSEYLHQSLSVIKSAPFILAILLCGLCFGVLMALIETYWQPVFMNLAHPWQKKLLGFVAAAGFASSLAGNWLIQKRNLKTLVAQRKAYLLLQFTIIGCIFIFALQNSTAGFLITYGFVYLFIGSANVLEQTMLNRLVPNSQRAGLLSTLSLAMQIGGITSCVIAGFAVSTLGINRLWLITCCIALLLVAAASLIPHHQKSTTATSLKT